MRCDDDKARREVPVLGDGGGLETPDPDAAILIEDHTFEPALTARGETDAHTALIEGLASYLRRLWHAVNGRSVAFTRVVTDWADHEDGQMPPPTAVVQSIETGKYIDEQPGAFVRLGRVSDQYQAALVATGQYELEQVDVVAMCSDKIQRAGVRRMLEDAFSPVQWMSGFRLVLPRYHSAVACYSLVSAEQADTGEMVTAGIRPLRMRLTADCTVYRVHTLPLAHPVAGGNIVGNRRI